MQNVAGTAAESVAANQTEGLSAKPGVLRALTDLFCLRAEHDDEELARFRELCLRMTPDADASTLVYVASKLARHPNAPPGALSALLRAERACALIIAEYALNLPLADQIGIARGRDTELALALARRKGISGDITDALVMRREPVVLDALAENKTATFTRAAIERIGMFARQDAPFLEKFSARAEEPLVSAQEFLRASGLERARLLLAARRAHLGKPSAPAPKDEALVQDLREFAQTRAWDAFCARVAEAIGWEPRHAEPLVKDPGGEPLALLLCALGCARQDAVRVFLCCEAPISHSYPRVRTLSDVVRDTPPAAAIDLLEAAAGRTITRPALGPRQADARSQPRLAPSKSVLSPLPVRSPAAAGLPKAYTPDVRAHLWGATQARAEARMEANERGRHIDSVRPPRVKAASPAPARERPKAAVLLRRG